MRSIESKWGERGMKRFLGRFLKEKRLERLEDGKGREFYVIKSGCKLSHEEPPYHSGRIILIPTKKAKKLIKRQEKIDGCDPELAKKLGIESKCLTLRTTMPLKKGVRIVILKDDEESFLADFD